MFEIKKLPHRINLGNQNENDIKIIQIDVSAWNALYPGCAYHITAMRPGDAGNWPVTGVTHADGTLTWIVPNTVTSVPGQGSLVIHCTIDGKEKNTGSLWYSVGHGHEAMGEAPDPVADWIADATSKLAEVDHFVDETIDATEAANAAALRAENGEDAREQAEGLRVLAEQGRQDSYGLAESARDGLYEAAEIARDEQFETAETARETAEGLRVGAETSRNTAEGLRVLAEQGRQDSYVLAEQGRQDSYGLAEEARDELFESAETTRNTQSGEATDRANAIAGTLEGIAPLWSDVGISVSALGEGAAPTASITQGETGTSISLGIPKGDTGAQGPIGNVMYATFDIDFDTGELVMTIPDGYTGPTFSINDETGELEVSI